MAGGDRIQQALSRALLPVGALFAASSLGMLVESPSAFLQHLVNGVTLGALFALIALGYTMVYGIVELINFAHGEVFMVGSFLGLITLRTLFDWGVTSIWIAPPIALLVAMVGAGALGVSLDSIAYKPLRRAPSWRSVGVAALSVVGLWLVLNAGLQGGITVGRVAGGVLLVGGAAAAYAFDIRYGGNARAVPRINALLSAVGMSILLQNVVMLAIGRDTQTFPQVSDFTGLDRPGWEVLGVQLLYVDVVTFVSAVLLMLGLDRFVTGSRLGKGMRATAQDPDAAMMLGIPVHRVITTTFVIGSALGAAAGILYGLRYGGVKFTDGFAVGTKAFVAAVLGGIGNLRGAMLGGFLLGLSETIVIAILEFGWEGIGRLLSKSGTWPQGEFHDYKDVIAFAILIGVLTLRPAGLLGKPAVDKV